MSVLPFFNRNRFPDFHHKIANSHQATSLLAAVNREVWYKDGLVDPSNMAAIPRFVNILELGGGGGET
jgi:hypothetical protein